jgi:hypothetical protein
VTREDRLPLKLCCNCTEALKNIDELSEKSFENELRLRLLLDMDDTAATTSLNYQVKESAEVSRLGCKSCLQRKTLTSCLF